MSDKLFVYLSGTRVARLTQDAGRLTLHYELDAAPLSARLPTCADPYEDDACRPFFANLFPEGAWRDALCRQLGIARDDDFSLLARIGADCAGAVSLHEESNWQPSDGRYRETTVAALRSWVKNPAQRPQAQQMRGLRLSLAGAQDKLLIHIDDGGPKLCEDGAPSTVIIKPDIVDPFNEIKLSGLNELYCMRLAARPGLTVAETFWFASAFATTRYDRQPDGGRWRRLHQEDFAQLLGRAPTAKYDIGWRDSFELATRYTATPALARVELLDRLLFNLLIGNLDAHGKNFALLHTSDQRLVLAPAYDLLCTELYPSLSENFAMPIGGAETAAALSGAAWTTFSADVGVSLKFVRERATVLCARVDDNLAKLSHDIESSEPELCNDVYPRRHRTEMFEGIKEVIAANQRHLMRSMSVR